MSAPRGPAASAVVEGPSPGDGGPLDHVHDSPLSLALDLDRAEAPQLRAIRDRAASCAICRDAVDTLDYWLAVLDHNSPRVGPEFVTRHRLFSDLFADVRPHTRRLRRLCRDDLFHHWGLCRLLLDESREAFPSALAYSLELAELSFAAAKGLDSSFYGASWSCDLRAEAAAHLAVLLSESGDTGAGTELLRAARDWLARGSGRSEVAQRVQISESLSSRDSGLTETLRPTDASAARAAHKPFPEHRPGPVHRLLGC